jgi:transposase
MRTFEKLPAGYLVIDDTTISKRFAASIENLSFVFDTKLGKSILGLQLVLIIWSNGEVAIPLALRVYQKNTGKTKIDLACELIEHAKKLGIKPEFITFDCWYAAEQLLKLIDSYGWTFVTRLKNNRKLNGIPLREAKRNPYWMMTGKLAGGQKVLVVRNGKRYFATNDLALSREEVISRYKLRWVIETVFRMLHSKLGLDKCQGRKITAQTAHFHLCLMAYLVLEKESYFQKKSVYKIKRQCSFNFQYAESILNKLNFQGA